MTLKERKDENVGLLASLSQDVRELGQDVRNLGQDVVNGALRLVGNKPDTRKHSVKRLE